MHSFELELNSKGFYNGYNPEVNPTIANAFSTAAYRFGHSMVQNSFVRTDEKHRPIFNNVSLHDEFTNFENIWSFGSVDRTLLGFCNQPAQRRDEFVCDELSNHLFQTPDLPFGMDLTAINIQRGRDHGIPSYTSWREPCGLTPIKSWDDLEKIFNIETVRRFRQIYRHVDDIDLFSGGLAEKPVRGAVVGPIFACIIAQQFSNLRKGDRFWYENAHLPSSFTPAQLQQIRKTTFASVLCHTMDEIETIQPFVFLISNEEKNSRHFCTENLLKNIDLIPWIESNPNDVEKRSFIDLFDDTPSNNKRQTKLKYRRKKKPDFVVSNTNNIIIKDKDGDKVKKSTYSPLEVNIKIQYFPSRFTQAPTAPVIKNKQKLSTSRPTVSYQVENPVTYPIFIQSLAKPTTIRPTAITNRPNVNNEYNYYDYRPTQMFNRPTAGLYDTPIYRPVSSNDYDEVQFEDRPFSSSLNKPYTPMTNHFLYNEVYITKRPVQSSYEQDISDYFYQKFDNNNKNNKYTNEEYVNNRFGPPTKIYSTGYVHRVDGHEINDKLDFKSKFVNRNKVKNTDDKFVKISSIKSHAAVSSSSAVINTVLQREGDQDISEEDGDLLRLVEMDVAPSDTGNWLIFDENEELALELNMPKIDFKLTTSEEIPKPIKKLNRKIDTYK
ncbi:unnamed protein product [Psylliodes chrysocephalus]|uniref:Uncharacterized protein n=1 Tax=Psylliodes chrysocephalus TaxID=3402493 RepID=A0A9P0CJR7_9CUCU|nr:unnamed protein product [Psylliodes chrysocephala]